MRLLAASILSTLLLGCSSDSFEKERELAWLKNRVVKTSDATAALSSLVSSDFSLCLGETTGAMTRNLCRLALSATNEIRWELRGELSVFAQVAQSQLDDINNDLVTLAASGATDAARIETLRRRLALLESIPSAEAAITMLQAVRGATSTPPK